MKSVYFLTVKSLMRSLKTYIFLAAMIMAEGAFLTFINFNNNYPAVEYSLEFIVLVLMMLLPLLTAELFAADRESGMEKTLLSLGLSESALFFGKTLALATVALIPCLLLLVIPLIFDIFGTVNYLSAFAALISFLFLAVALIALSAFISVTAKKRKESYIITYAALLLIYFFGIFAEIVPVTKSFSLLLLTAFLIVISICIYLFTRSAYIFGGVFCISEGLLILFYFVTPKAFAYALSTFFNLLSPTASLNSIIYGMFDITALIHIILFAAVFVLLSLMQLKRRKYQ